VDSVRKFRSFNVVPSLPPRLQPLRDIAFNLWWTWNPEAHELFRRIDRQLWEEVEHNPVKLLGSVTQERLNQLLETESFLAHMDKISDRLNHYMKDTTWYRKNHAGQKEMRIAYFSTEFGIHECLPIYSGGLGVLAGDHIKSASDLGLPLVGVGLLYRHGYLRQYLNRDGWQQETYPINDFENLPLQKDETGHPTQLELTVGSKKILVLVWKLQVGRVPVYLLDCNIPGQPTENREITSQLYGGDKDMRIRQEIVLGIGGLQVLHHLGITPSVIHMNEGHSAFLALERIRLLMNKEKGISFKEAREVVAASNTFTTHTPVPAGNDTFSTRLMEKHFTDYVASLGISWQTFMDLGTVTPRNHHEDFCMTILALKLSSHANGVSRLHGRVSRKMWQPVWPSVPEEEIPIKAITNGVHTRSWLSDEFKVLFDRYLGPRWIEKPVDREIWNRVNMIPNSEIWRAHERLRVRLVAFSRQKLKQQLVKRGAPFSEAAMAEEVLDPEALTIGFSRRFAAYKRASLIFHDLDRLAGILNDKNRPVQLIFAGKAHPQDSHGKELIKQIIHTAEKEPFRNKVVFLEDYDINIARYLVQGVDLWLNTPRRPLEASGTSGMKVTANGGLNVSVLDGWWDEAYQVGIGWAIGRGEEYEDQLYQDEVESQTLYDLLEKEIVPLYYHRGQDGLPRGWIELMKKSMMAIIPYFNTNRMVKAYFETFYLPCHRFWEKLSADHMKRAKELAGWKESIRGTWKTMKIMDIQADDQEIQKAGTRLKVRARINPGGISPDEVVAELFYGLVGSAGEIVEVQTAPMDFLETDSNGFFLFEGFIPCDECGRYSYTIRILPKHEDMVNKYETGLITWFQS
jgi:starch phosphorylase